MTMPAPAQKSDVCPGGNKTNVRIAGALAVIVVAMVGMAYAAVPLYDLFCRATGYGGTTQRADAGADNVLEREITVRFDANVSGMSWNFRPAAPQMTLKVGETGIATFVATSTAIVATSGTATFNVTPDAAGAYFNKIECFCFTRQDLKPGETVEMGVQFFIDPAIVDESDLDATLTITLSYSFFPVKDAENTVADARGIVEKAGQPVTQTITDEALKRL
ncbi:MAG: cytochrome c oxidase assembly protein [Alphaproteobacteria bacterium]